MAGEKRSFVIDIAAKTAGAIAGLMGVRAALGTLAASSVYAGTKLESAMVSSGIALQGAGSSAEEMVGAFHKMRVAGSEFLPVAELFAKAGIKGTESIVELSKSVKMMADVTGRSAASVAESSAGMIASLGLTADEGMRLNSMFFLLEKSSLTDSASLEILTKRLGGTWREVGMGLPVLAGLAAALDLKGLPVRQASAALGQLTEWMDVAHGKGRAFAAILRLSTAEFSDFNKQTPDEKLRRFIVGLGKMSKIRAEVSLRALGISGDDAVRALRMVGKDTEGLNKLLKSAQEGFKDTSALTKQHEKVSKTLGYQIDYLGRKFAVLGEKIGAKLVPLVKLAIKVVDYLGEMILSYDWGGLASGLEWAFAAAMATFEEWKPTLIEWRDAFADAVIYAYDWWIKTWEEMKPSVYQFFSDMKKWVVDAYDWVVKSWEQLPGNMEQTWTDIMAYLDYVGAWWGQLFTDMGTAAWEAIVWLATPFTWLYTNVIAPVAEEIWATLSALWADVVAYIGPVVKVIAGYWTWFYESIFVPVVKGLVAYWMWGIGLIVDYFGWIFPLIWSIAKPIFEAMLWVQGKVADAWVGLFSAITGGAPDAWSALKSLCNPLEMIWNLGKSIYNTLFGSGLFHLEEGVADAIPALEKLGAKMEMIDAKGAAAKVRIGEGTFSAKPVSASAGDFSSSSSEGYSGPGFKPGLAASPEQGKIIVPVTVTLDGFVLARAMAEHIFEVGQERHLNESAFPMRGIER